MRITPDEIRLIAFILVALLVGAAVSHRRQIQRDHSNKSPSAQSSSPQVPGKVREE